MPIKNGKTAIKVEYDKVSELKNGLAALGVLKIPKNRLNFKGKVVMPIKSGFKMGRLLRL